MSDRKPLADTRLLPRSLPARRARLPAAGLADVIGGVARWDGVHVTGTPREAAEVRSLAFFDCELDGLSLAGRQVELRLIDCTASALDLANAQFDSLEFSSTVVMESRLVGAQLGGALRDVTFGACQFDLASLRMARLSRVEFDACSLVETDAYAATFDSVLFTACDLTNAEFAKASFERSEMNRCDLTSVRGIASLRGVRIPLADLLPVTPLLAEALGIVAT